MLGKGAKRKHAEDEEGPEGEATVALAALAEGALKASYSLQRQTIFNMSLMKLYHPRAAAEPSLERRLLISNVLRRIQDELRQEGGARAPPASPPPPPQGPIDEGFREAAGPQPSNPALPDSCLTPASLLEADASLFCSSPSPHTFLLHSLHYGPPRSPTALPPPTLAAKDSFASALDEIEELCPAPTVTTTSLSPGEPAHELPLPSMLPTGGDLKDKDGGQKPEARVPPVAQDRLLADTPPGSLDIGPSVTLSPSSTSSSGFLTDLALDDILFADIDTSMYDFDPCTTTAGGGTSKMAPMVTADDLVKTLSPYGNGGPPSATQSQPFKMDLAELDHIMEVLVGS